MGKLSKNMAKKTARLLDSVLKLDANSSSCYVIFQPKAPKELLRYRRKK